MALIHCSECHSEVSETAKSCPKCGCEIKTSSSKYRPTLLLIGSAVNIIGGLGFILMYVLLLLTGNSETESNTTISLGVNDSYSLIYSLAYIFLIVITVTSIILLIRKNLSRKAALIMTAIQLVMAVVALIFLVIVWNLTICCVGWIVIWGNALQLIGSILCLSGAFKIGE